ncbi:MAG: hypothetical protein ACKO1G_18365, partial [Microcystis aeruginosa]
SDQYVLLGIKCDRSLFSYQLSVISYQFLKARGKRQEAKGRIWQFSYLKRRLETKHIRDFSLTN